MQITLDINLDLAEDVLSDYYGITLPQEKLLEIVMSSGQLIGELVDNSIGDTCAREMLIDAVTQKVGARDWPTYGDHADMEAYYKDLAEKLAAIGGTMRSEE